MLGIIMYKIPNSITNLENTVTKIRFSGVPQKSNRINKHTEIEGRTLIQRITYSYPRVRYLQVLSK